MFFLTGGVNRVRLRSPEEGEVLAWAFTLLERTKRGSQHVIAYWGGTEAETFVQVHRVRLKRGQALNLELDRIAPAPDGLRGHVLTCSLAPDRWPSHHVEPLIDYPNQPRPIAA